MQRFDGHRMRTGKTQADAVRMSEDVWKILYDAQIPRIKDFLEEQARRLAQALANGQTVIRFSLPERIMVLGPQDGQSRFVTIPRHFLKHRVGSFLKRANRENIQAELITRFAKLKGSNEPGISYSASLLCHVVALHLVEHMVPAGREVSYIATGSTSPEAALYRPLESFLDYPPETRHFYLPQWVSFDQRGNLLVSSLEEAESRVAVLQRFMSLLQVAIDLAPYLNASDAYWQKRSGLRRQLINHGYALAHGWTGVIIDTIRGRAAAGTLNRGLNLSLPYFDDQALLLRSYDFEVIPRGRVEFVPAFVVCAVRNEAEKVLQDTSLSVSTRNHLLSELRTIERAFETPGGSPRGGIKERTKQPAVWQADIVPS